MNISIPVNHRENHGSEFKFVCTVLRCRIKRVV